MKIIELRRVPKNKIGKIIKTGDVSPWPHEETILREAVASLKQVPEIRRLRYITKDGKLVDIKP